MRHSFLRRSEMHFSLLSFDKRSIQISALNASDVLQDAPVIVVKPLCSEHRYYASSLRTFMKEFSAQEILGVHIDSKHCFCVE